MNSEQGCGINCALLARVGEASRTWVGEGKKQNRMKKMSAHRDASSGMHPQRNTGGEGSGEYQKCAVT